MVPKTITKKLEAFLANKRRSRGGGWADVTEADMVQLQDLIQNIIDAKCGLDADGDQTIEFQLINRNTHRGVQFYPVPYENNVVLTELNFDIATSAYRTARQLERLKKDQK